MAKSEKIKLKKLKNEHKEMKCNRINTNHTDQSHSDTMKRWRKRAIREKESTKLGKTYPLGTNALRIDSTIIAIHKIRRHNSYTQS